MAGQIKLAAASGGSVTLDAANTASNFTMTIPAANGVAVTADSTTGAAQIPAGTTAQRPGTPATGQLRYNTTTGGVEVYSGTSWGGLSTSYNATVLVVGGGGSGSVKPGGYGGGGGGGGVIQTTQGLTIGTTYSVVVGGASGYSSFGAAVYGLGACSGNGANQGESPSDTKLATQGYAGGSATPYASGGGGGAGAAGGGAGFPDYGGFGGTGATSTITGSTTYWGGGGGGGGSLRTATGSLGGGGNYASGGTVNTGGGGGGQGAGGGSGVVIVSVPTSNYTGTTTGSPTVTTNGSNTVMQFNSSGSYTA